MVKEIMIKDKEQVVKIHELACHVSYPVWVSNSAMMLDARSLLGLFALVGKKANVVAGDSADPKAFARLVKKMA